MRVLILPGDIFRGQSDFFSSGSRISNISNTGISVKVFYNNILQSWGVQDGTSVNDQSISSGNVYFNQIPSAVGFYSVRLFPDRIGFWRIIITHTLSSSEYVLEFDVKGNCTSSGGIAYSFL
jgi:hypothetical protein